MDFSENTNNIDKELENQANSYESYELFPLKKAGFIYYSLIKEKEQKTDHLVFQVIKPSRLRTIFFMSQFVIA